MNKQLKKYMSANKFWWTVLTVVMIALCVVFVISAIAGNDVKYYGLVVFLVILGLSLIPQYKSKKFYEKLEKHGDLPQVVADFEGAVAMRKNTVRFGEHWVFMKGKEKLLAYEDIRQVYQYIHKSNFIENERALKYVNSKGKAKVLCKLELRGKSDEELAKMVAIILSKNPELKVGYR